MMRCSKDKRRGRDKIRNNNRNRKRDMLVDVALFFMFFILSFMLPYVSGKAKAVRTVRMKDNISMKKLTPVLQKKISASTPREKSSSDLMLLQRATRVSTARLLQGYTSDGKYYYYLSQLSNQKAHKDDLRLTRVKYTGLGKYSENYMTLKKFGHGTNLDCTVKNGVTWLWTGSDAADANGGTTSISCFTFKAGTTLKKHGQISYRIPITGSKSRYASNCFPAINDEGTLLAVRFTNQGKQQFQIYDLTDGVTVSPVKAKKTLRLQNTKGDFQGFDIRGTTIYTLEGTARRSEMKELGKAGSFAPIKIRSYDYATGKYTTKKIKGAPKLTHREPEGIQVDSDGVIRIMIASHYKNLYSCANIYQVK